MKTRTDLPSLRLLSLVSGFPEPKRSQRWILMLQAFCDESLDSDGFFVMAGYVAPVENWLRFNDQWQGVLDLSEHPYQPIPRFKMSAMSGYRGLRRAEKFYRVIEEHATAAFSVRIDVAAMKRAKVRAKWPVALEDDHAMSNPYYFAFRLVTEGLAKVQSQLGLAQPVDFVFDEHTSSKYCSRAWDSFKDKAPPEFKQYLGAPPIFRKEEEYLPLQAADLYAWWVRKWALAGVDGDGVEHQRFAWKPNKLFPRFHWIFGEEEFVEEYEHELAGIKAMFPEDAEALSEAVTAEYWENKRAAKGAQQKTSTL